MEFHFDLRAKMDHNIPHLWPRRDIPKQTRNVNRQVPECKSNVQNEITRHVNARESDLSLCAEGRVVEWQQPCNKDRGIGCDITYTFRIFSRRFQKASISSKGNPATLIVRGVRLARTKLRLIECDVNASFGSAAFDSTLYGISAMFGKMCPFFQFSSNSPPSMSNPNPSSSADTREKTYLQQKEYVYSYELSWR